MQSRAVFVVAFLLSSNAAALAESGRPANPSAATRESVRRGGFARHAASEGPFAQAFARSLCRRGAPLCTSAINYSVRQQ